MKEMVKHGLISFLLALGLTLSMLGCMDMLDQGLLAAGVIVVLTAAMSFAGMKKLTAWIAGGVLAAGCALWLLTGGVETFAEILRAITLHFTGLNGALPMVAGPAAILLAVIAAAAAFVLTNRSMGAYPALAVMLLAAMLIWLSDESHALPWLAPAVAGVMIQAAVTGHEELNLRRVLPLAVIVTALAFLATPMGGVTIEPLKDAADKLREQIFARFMFTQPRNVFSLASEGYYPQGANQLGGKAEPTDHPVMLVKTSRKTYLRGSVKNEYTGRVWVDTLSGRRYLWNSLQWRDSRQQVFDMSLPEGALGEDSGLTAHQNVSVQMLSGSASSLFVPQRIRVLNPGGELVPYFNLGSETFVTRDLATGDTYTVTAPLMLAGDAGLGTLIDACEATEDPQYPQILHDYTTLPEHLQEQVYQLAIKATEGAQTPYEKAYALQTYLARSFTYTLDVAPQPENIDFVSNFLLNTQEGYCTYFASAMTVLCRMVGLPARYVEGYLAEPDAEDHAYVTGLHGHAWTEVYFSGFGWLTFDATPLGSRVTQPPEDMLPPDSEPEPTATPEPEAAPPQSEPESTATPEPETIPPERREADTPTPPPAPNQEPERKDPPDLTWLWWLLPLLLAALAALRLWWTQPMQKVRRAKDEMGRWSVWMQALNDSLTVLKLPRQANESPMAYMRRMDSLRRFSGAMIPIGECAALVFYGRMTPEPEETAMAAAAYAHVHHTLTWWQKAKLALVRGFVPEKKRSFTK